MTDSEDTNAARKKLGLWARMKQHLLYPELTPEQVAWSFGLGFAIAMNPLLGLHTGMVLGLCFFFRKLHRPLMFLAAFLNNPWTLVPIATTSAYVGNVLLGRGLALDLASIHWASIGWRSFSTRQGLLETYTMMKPILLPYLVGGFVLSVLALIVGYVAMRRVTSKLRAMHLHLPHIHLPHLTQPGKPLE